MANEFYQEVKRSARCVFGAEWDADFDLREMVIGAARHTGKRLRQLERGRDGSRERSRGMLFHHLNASSTKLCGVILAASKKKVAITGTEALELASSINLRRPCGETVRVVLTPKKHQKPGSTQIKVRPIVISGIIRTACQRIFRDCLRAMLPAPKTEYAAAGKGRDAAVKTLVKNLNAGIGDHLLIFDVKDFFPSITNKMLDGIIPLPHSVREACLFIEKGAPVQKQKSSLCPSSLYQSFLYKQSDVPLRLSQGSLASPDVASHVMHDLMKAIPVKSRSQSFVDDGAAVASSNGEAQTTIHALISRASAQPGGPLSLKSIDVFKPNQPGGAYAEYLGYHLKSGPNDKVRAVPAPRLITGLMERITEKLKATPFDQQKKVGFGMANAWRKSQSAWDFKPGANIFWAQVHVAIWDASHWHSAKAKGEKFYYLLPKPHLMQPPKTSTS